MLLHHLPLPGKIKQRWEKISHVFFLLSSWKTVSDHFLFFPGCILSPVQTRKERDLSHQGFPNGYSRVESWGDFSTGEMMYLKSSEIRQHCCKHRRGHFCCPAWGVAHSCPADQRGGWHPWLWTFPVNHWWLLPSACVWRVHIVCRQILRLCRWRDHINQMREETEAWLF